MNVLMLLDEEFPPDSRVEKEAISLMNDGHNVTIACYTRKNAPTRETYNGIEVRRMPISKLTYKLSAACLAIPIYFWHWKLFIRKIVKELKPDVIHVHDLPLSKVGYHFKKLFACKLVCDQHEFYSDWIVHTAHMNTLVGKLVKFFSDWKAYEKKYLHKADLVITVAEPLKENYIKNYNISESKIITVPNTPSEEIYNIDNINQEIIDTFKNNYVVFYAGGIDILRGIDTAIRALPIIKQDIPNIKLLLGGKIVKPYDPLKTAHEIGVDSIVEFIGWVKEEDLPSYIFASKVCFFTPPANRDEINNTIATKIYQYAIMGKPIITSSAKMMKNFVEQNNLGFSIDDGDFKGFAEAVLNCKELTFAKLDEGMKRKIIWENTITPMLEKYREFKQ